MKRKIAKMIIISLAAVLSLTVKVNASAFEKKDAYNAYYKLVKKIHQPGEFSGGYDQYQLIYLNNDKVPELLAVDTPEDIYDNNGTYQYALYTFYKGKAKKLGEFSSGVASAGGYRGSTRYIKKSGKIYETYISSGTGDGSDIVYEMKNGKLKKKSKGDYHIATETQEWNEKTVSEKDYGKELNKAFNTKKAVDFETIKTMSYGKMLKKLK